MRVCVYAMSRSLFCDASISPTTTRPCGLPTSRSLFWHSCLILRRKNTKAFYLSHTRHLVSVPANNAHVLLCMRQFCTKCPPWPGPGFLTLTLFNVLNVIKYSNIYNLINTSNKTNLLGFITEFYRLSIILVLFEAINGSQIMI